ncbi:MAG: ArsR family transcriptional regulator [Candidatus Thorarchaeota archaeon]|nr:MAG: ArsR family transcriptional regulator [Candidatus Thorarchaeota archaeon]
MERLSELLFELSNEDRLRILTELEESPAKLTHISQKLDLTVQETSRHLARMTKAGLIGKTSKGQYQSTSYGTQIIELLPSFEFLSSNREYFTGHSVSGLPRRFIGRLGELAQSIFADNAVVLFQQVDSLVSQAEKFVWIQSDQALASTLPLMVGAMERGATIRTLLPPDLGPPNIPGEMIPDFSSYRSGQMENRHLESIDVLTILSEKSAVVAFPNLEGRMDYLGFSINDEMGLDWCKDLFLHFWEQGVPI